MDLPMIVGFYHFLSTSCVIIPTSPHLPPVVDLEVMRK